MAGFLDELRAYVANTGRAGGGGDSISPGPRTPTGPGVTPSGVRMAQPRPFVAPPGALPSSPVGRPPAPAGGAGAGPTYAGGISSGVSGGAAQTSPGGGAAPPAGDAGGAIPGAGAVPTLLPPGAAPVGYPDPSGSGSVILSPEGKKAYQDRIVKARRAFGPYPGADDPSKPPPPITPGKMFFNPFTGRYGKA